MGQAGLNADGTVSGRSPQSISSYPGSELAEVPAVGAPKTAIVFVDSADHPHAPSEDPQALFASVSAGVRGMLTTMSYGRLNLDIQGAGRPWVRIETAPSASLDEVFKEVWDQLVASAPAGTYDGVQSLIIARPAAQNARTWTHGGPIPGTPLRGVVNWGVQSGSRSVTLLTHEIGHLLGLPDLYVQLGMIPRTASFDLMSYHAAVASPDLFAWSKWKLGWLDDGQIACWPRPGSSGTRTLSPLHVSGGVKALVVPTSSTTAQVAEVRGTGGVDGGACSSGVVIYSVDTSTWTAHGPVTVKGSGHGTCDLRFGPAYDNAAWPAGSTYTDPDTRLKWTIGAKAADGSYQVGVSAPVTYAGMTAMASNVLASYRLGEPGGSPDVSESFTNTRAYPSQGDPALIGTYRNGVALGVAGDGLALPAMGDLVPRLDGIDDHISIPPLGVVGDFTVEGWTKLESGLLGTMFGGPSTELVVAAGGVVGSVTADGQTTSVAVVTAPNTGEWHHWALVRQGSVLMVYRDGVAVVGRAGAPTAPITLAGTIGARNGSGGALKGSIDEVTFYRAAMAPSTTGSRYRRGTTGTP